LIGGASLTGTGSIELDGEDDYVNLPNGLCTATGDLPGRTLLDQKMQRPTAHRRLAFGPTRFEYAQSRLAHSLSAPRRALFAAPNVLVPHLTHAPTANLTAPAFASQPLKHVPCPFACKPTTKQARTSRAGSCCV